MAFDPEDTLTKTLAHRNPWSTQYWSLTEQGKIFAVHGLQMARHLAETAGLKLSEIRLPAKEDLPPAPIAESENPWEAGKWNLTRQAEYLTRYGVEKATKAARLAGSSIGAIRPPAIQERVSEQVKFLRAVCAARNRYTARQRRLAR